MTHPNPVVRAKLVCHGKTPHSHNEGMQNVQLGAVWSPTDTGKPHDENALFGSLTPFANFVAAMVDSAADRFVVGQEYYLDFTPCPSKDTPPEINLDEEHF